MLKQIRYQEKAVNSLVDKTIELLNLTGNRKKLIFKAPTGAGKTVMASEMLARLAQELPERSDSRIKQAAFIWIAPNKLHEQSYFKMKNYFTETQLLRPVMYDELDHSVDGYIKSGEILFVNWESINKDNAVMIRDTELSASLYDITNRTQIDNHIPIIAIIDEEHMFGGRNAVKSEQVLKNIQPKVEIRISATPITSGDEMVSIPRESVVAEEMIKEGIILNPALNVTNSMGLTSNQWLVKEALDKRNEIAKAYEKLGVKINPLLLIQLPNDSSERTTSEDETIKEEVIAYLDTIKSINTANGKLAIWLSGEKTNLENIEEPDNLTEVLLFKQAIALGWDCPRAAVLLIFRKLESFTFTVQTIGRILRMPEQKFYTNEILNKGYVYTDLSKDQIQIVADDMDYISTLRAVRRENLNNVSLTSSYVERKATDRNRLGSDFKRVLKEKIAQQWTLIYEPSLFSFFDFETGEDRSDMDEDSKQKNQVAENRLKAGSHIKLDVRSITIDIPKDLLMEDEVGLMRVDNQVKFARTETELNRVFDNYCIKQLSGWERHQSLSNLENALVEIMEELFEIFETEAKKVILYHANQPKFADVITKALNEYEKVIMKRRAKAAERELHNYQWEVPEDRIYNEGASMIDEEKKNHALLPFIRLKDSSNPELGFAKYLEDNSQYIDWWYKNGDNGKLNYAIPYFNVNNERALFYVDFIVRMKNGQVFLFDTKTEGSDVNAVKKHNALIDYINSEEIKPQGLKGGVIIESKGNWKFSPLKIANTTDIVSWDCFYPDQYCMK